MNKKKEIRDWKIVLYPKDPMHSDQGGTLEIVRGKEEEVIEILEGWARAIKTYGRVPVGLDWQNRSIATILNRAGKFRFHARVECFEQETESGYTKGGAWLAAI